MQETKRGELHPRNRLKGRYDLVALGEVYPSLRQFITRSKGGDLTVNFFDAEAVRALNSALLLHHYGVKDWVLPSSALVPPIPGRADYIHYLGDIVGEGARVLDVGVGASCIYPILGVVEYGWEVVGSDISVESLESASRIVEANEQLRGHIELRHQSDRDHIYIGVIGDGERFDITLCNPPFHDSPTSAHAGTERKLRNLKGRKAPQRSLSQRDLNFGGVSNELWCEGGELRFITRMIDESREFRNQCRYFSTLVSKESNLPALRRELSAAKVTHSRIIEMSQGSKKSRILLWSFR